MFLASFQKPFGTEEDNSKVQAVSMIWMVLAFRTPILLSCVRTRQLGPSVLCDLRYSMKVLETYSPPEFKQKLPVFEIVIFFSCLKILGEL